MSANDPSSLIDIPPKGKISKEYTELLKCVKELTPEEQQSVLKNLLQDPLLNDIPADVTSSKVHDLIMLETGQAFAVSIIKNSGEEIVLTVTPTTSIGKLKKQYQKYINDIEECKISPRKISWKYVWRHYCLVHHGTKLLDDEVTLAQIGAKQQSQFSFCELKREKRKSMRREK